MGSPGTFAAIYTEGWSGTARLSLRVAQIGKSRDIPDLGFFTFADAASLRARRIEFAASRLTFRLRTFNDVD